ncbi:MAG: hypothetical protein N2Z23_07430, partial [Pyrinomonadaceae bacterium]|nr:hypothetical protein [Pyrinomonadaceae bacterium]MCX7640255.1 hypothetical protein [Pyrinomonadaceae bacterium]MDW8303375.1 hypothetical protein [Acidobacteriota bacterium]
MVSGRKRRWQVAEVALSFPVLEEPFAMDFFLLTSCLDDWGRKAKGLVPADAGAMADRKPPVSMGQSERAG